MTLSFPRQQAGEYNVVDNGKYVGLIQKLNASKWCVYFCSNPATKGKPQNVSKTLKDCKAFCENHFAGVVTEEVARDTVPNTNTPDVKELMREMLKRGNVLNLNSDEIDVDSMDLSDVVDLEDDADFSHFLNEEEALVY